MNGAHIPQFLPSENKKTSFSQATCQTLLELHALSIRAAMACYTHHKTHSIHHATVKDYNICLTWTHICSNLWQCSQLWQNQNAKSITTVTGIAVVSQYFLNSFYHFLCNVAATECKLTQMWYVDYRKKLRKRFTWCRSFHL